MVLKECLLLLSLLLGTLFLWWEDQLPDENEKHVGDDNCRVCEDEVYEECWDKCDLVWSNDCHGPEDDEEIVRYVRVEGASSDILVSIIIELLISYIVHRPCDEVEPHIGSSCVKALDGVVIIKWIEKEESKLSVVLWAAEGVEEDGSQHGQWSPSGLAHLVPGSQHLLEVKLIAAALTEEYCVIVDHHKQVVELHVWLLGLPVIEGNCTAWTNALHPHGILVAILGVDQQLEGVEDKHDAHKGEG